jgi:Flp pilus assembly protein TadG
MRTPKRQDGAELVEFSLALLIMLTFVLAIVDFARMLFLWNAANEAVRAGARYAVVCDDATQKDAVLARMRGLLPQIQDIEMQWDPDNSCTSANCQGVTVSITSLEFRWISPIAGLAAALPVWQMPRFPYYLSRELMRQDTHSATICM